MISDTLFDAAEEIRGYLERTPEAYADYCARLTTLLTEMDSLRRELDTAPPKDILEQEDIGGQA
jgi:hypothetical protein